MKQFLIYKFNSFNIRVAEFILYVDFADIIRVFSLMI